jgi:dihydrofolate reductase
LNKAIELAREYEKDVYIIGGGQIYEQAMPIADELIVTHVNCEMEADTFFPTIDLKNWQILSSEKFSKDSKNEYDFEIVHYIKK